MLAENLQAVREKIKAAAEKSGRSEEDITLIAVTKTHPPEIINEAIDLGVTDIGENKVQEILEKYDSVKPVRWHLIGHLQTNKVKYIVDKVCMIHSVDSIKLMDEIERQSAKRGVVMKILIQINISEEETKFGIAPEELEAMLLHAANLKHVKVCGLMTIAPKLVNNMSNRLHFDNIHKIYLDISKKKYDNVNMEYLSMGMSGDYEAAIEAGSDTVRIGSALFGARNYRLEGNQYMKGKDKR